MPKKGTMLIFKWEITSFSKTLYYIRFSQYFILSTAFITRFQVCFYANNYYLSINSVQCLYKGNIAASGGFLWGGVGDGGKQQIDISLIFLHATH